MSALDNAPDPTALYRIRDGVYAADLLIAAVTEFDLFTRLAEHGPVTVADACALLGGPALGGRHVRRRHEALDADPCGRVQVQVAAV
ncbi:hypothetical protein ACWEAO_12075, partial [Micrococcus luteus]